MELLILENLAIDMIEAFFLDPMHLVYLGCMKKLPHIWVNERRSMKIRMSSNLIKEISRLLVSIEELIPVLKLPPFSFWGAGVRRSFSKCVRFPSVFFLLPYLALGYETLFNTKLS